MIVGQIADRRAIPNDDASPPPFAKLSIAGLPGGQRLSLAAIPAPGLFPRVYRNLVL
jgi:hypothetical protein